MCLRIKAGKRFTGWILVITLAAAFSTAGGAAPIRPEPARYKLYAELTNQILSPEDGPGTFEWPSARKEKQIRSRLHNLVQDEINRILQVPDVSTKAVQRAIMALQGTAEMSGAPDNLPFVLFFQINSVPSVAIGYSVVFGGGAIPVADPYLNIYQREGVSWRYKGAAPVDSEFSGSSFFISPIAAGHPGEEWFLAWRQTFGDTGAKRRVRLFAFDGTNWRTIWKRNELVGGEVSVSRSSIKLSFDKEYHSRFRVFERYEVTPTGIRLAARKLTSH